MEFSTYPLKMVSPWIHDSWGFFFFFLIELSFGFQCHIMIVRSFHLSNVGAST